MPKLTLTLLAEDYSICRLPPAAAEAPGAPAAGAFSVVVRAPDEVTLVCPSDQAPQAEIDAGWRCFRIDQTFAFDVPGILAAVLQPLASAGIGIFATSTFSTDYVLVKREHLADAMAVLREAGHGIAGSRA